MRIHKIGPYFDLAVPKDYSIDQTDVDSDVSRDSEIKNKGKKRQLIKNKNHHQKGKKLHQKNILPMIILIILTFHMIQK